MQSMTFHEFVIFGRTHEMDNVMNLLDAFNTLLIPGIAGIGKTTMAAKLIENYMHRRNLLYHRCQEKTHQRSFRKYCRLDGKYG